MSDELVYQRPSRVLLIGEVKSLGQRRRTQEMNLYGLFSSQALGIGLALRERGCRTTSRS